MDEIIAVFNNRNQAMQFANYLRKMGVRCKTVSTPRELSVSCGLSVMFLSHNLIQARYLVQNNRFTGLTGIYQTSNNYMHKKYKAI